MGVAVGMASTAYTVYDRMFQWTSYLFGYDFLLGFLLVNALGQAECHYMFGLILFSQNACGSLILGASGCPSFQKGGQA